MNSRSSTNSYVSGAAFSGLNIPTIIPVSELNQSVSTLLERAIPLIWISGEVSNFTRATSGHCYFTLKDANAQVRAVMFRHRAQYADFLPRNGDQIEVRALVTLYAPRGDFQLNIEGIRRAGVGNLYEAFLKRKAKLEAAGFFSTENKLRLPIFPKTIGIITSPQAAALQDVLTTFSRRAQHVKLHIYPSPVQGEGAATKIAAAIKKASLSGDCDLLLLCRGGGSLEDLWSFNEEVVAKAISTSTTPIITGIGHETDVTIADFVADLRAATPTAAAELACRSQDTWLQELDTLTMRLQRGLQHHTHLATKNLTRISHSLINPETRINQEKVRISTYASRLNQHVPHSIFRAKQQLTNIKARLKAQFPDIIQESEKLNRQECRLQLGMMNRIKQAQQKTSHLEMQLNMLNPERTLARGYAIVQNHDGTILTSPNELHDGQSLEIKLAKGSATITAQKVAKKRAIKKTKS